MQTVASSPITIGNKGLAAQCPPVVARSEGSESVRRGRSAVARLLVALQLLCLPGYIGAQRIVDRGEIESGLPDAPVAVRESGQAGNGGSQRDSGSISGTVLDATGAVVPGALVSLTGPASGDQRTIDSTGDGSFTFANLPPGKYRVTVASSGLGSYVSPEMQLSAGDAREIPRVVLPIAPMNVDVRVTVSDVQLATEQVELAEQQRVFGVLPNFYTSYVWDAAPMTTKLKFNLALKSATDPVTFLGAGFLAGVEQANNTFPRYGQEAGGYFQRFGASYADDVIARMLGSAVFPSLLRQDPRYFYRGSGTTKSRVLYALGATFICKGDDGHWQPDVSYFAGSFGAGAIATLYHPPGNRGASLVLRNGLIDTGGHALNNVVREFLLRKLTSKVPDYAQGKP